jgi:hypothetical protein
MEILEVFTNYADKQVYSVGIKFKHKGKPYRACVDFESKHGNIVDVKIFADIRPSDVPLKLNADLENELMVRARKHCQS